MIPRYSVSFDTRLLPSLSCDVLVVGSGVAGLSAACAISKFCRVILVTKSRLEESTTRYAQGGIATVLDEHDSFESHIKDTLEAGAGLSDPEATEVLVREGPSRVIELLKDYDARFDVTNGKLDFAKEGGHSIARVVHARGDATGSEVERALAKAIIRDGKVGLLEKYFLVDLLVEGGMIRGALVLDKVRKKLIVIGSKAVVLASGGAGMAYLVTTNPPISTGDGLAAALRAGARVSDVEFVQFHPTALHIPEEPKFLISEAIRGQGAILVDVDGNRIMEGIHPLGDLAPRDIVVAQMFEVMKEQQKNHLYLDARHIEEDVILRKFPTIFKHCLEAGIDIRKNRIPVSPAAHYMSGGVVTDLDGQTDIPGLFACGEVACTGVHGANRLASNSLLEGLVFSRRIAKYIEENLKGFPQVRIPAISFERKWQKLRVHSELLIGNLRELMKDSVGIVRCERGLNEALDFFESNRALLNMDSNDARSLELKSMFTVGMLITKAAILRKETRGCHRRRDFPEPDDWNWKKHIDIKLEDEEIRVETRLVHNSKIQYLVLKHTI